MLSGCQSLFIAIVPLDDVPIGRASSGFIDAGKGRTGVVTSFIYVRRYKFPPSFISFIKSVIVILPPGCTFLFFSNLDHSLALELFSVFWIPKFMPKWDALTQPACSGQIPDLSTPYYLQAHSLWLLLDNGSASPITKWSFGVKKGDIYIGNNNNCSSLSSYFGSGTVLGT